MRIAVLGAGNIGTQFACVCAAKGHRVSVFSSQPYKFDREIFIISSCNQIILRGMITMCSDDIESVMLNADLVFVTHPAFMFSNTAKLIEPFVQDGMKIGIIPGTGGAEFAFRNCIDKGAVLFGLQRVPAVARLVEYGRTVCVEGKRDSLFLSSIPIQNVDEIAEFMSELFDMPCHSLPNYLSVTMTPSNPILHTTRLATMFGDYLPGKIYEKNILFYGEWSNLSSERLLQCDAEHQKILAKIKKMDLSSVKSLVVHYDNSDTPEKMTHKIRSIDSLHNLLSPMKKMNGGYIPDFDSQYFTADFPYGLAIIEEFADIVGADIPKIKETMKWYRGVTGDNSRLELSNYGLNTEEDVYRYYR